MGTELFCTSECIISLLLSGSSWALTRISPSSFFVVSLVVVVVPLPVVVVMAVVVVTGLARCIIALTAATTRPRKVATWLLLSCFGVIL